MKTNDDLLAELTGDSTQATKKDANLGALNAKLDEILFYVNVIKNSSVAKISTDEALTLLFTNQIIYLDTRDISITPHLMMRGIYEERLSKLIKQLVGDNDVYMDIGAGFGYYALLAGSEISPRGINFHLFEADENLITLLNKTLSVNGMAKYSRVNNMDMTDSDQAIDDYVSSNQIDRVDLVRIGVNGKEDVIYEGIRDTVHELPDMRVIIQFHFDQYSDPKAFFDLLRSDFEYIKTVPELGDSQEVVSYKELRSSHDGDIINLLLTNDAVEGFSI